VYPALDGLESFYEVADGEAVSETPAPFVALSVTVTSSVPIGVGLICRCFSSQQSAVSSTGLVPSLKVLACHRQP
jgi:hypothetical protein